MLVVSRVYPKPNEGELKKLQIKKKKFKVSCVDDNLDKPKNKYNNISNNLIVIQKVKFVYDTKDFYSVYPNDNSIKEKTNHLKGSKIITNKSSSKLNVLRQNIKILNPKTSLQIENLPLTNAKVKLPSIKPSINNITSFTKSKELNDVKPKDNLLTTRIQIKATDKQINNFKNPLLNLNLKKIQQIQADTCSSVSPAKASNKCNYFIIRKGNNKELIKSILLKRANWRESASDFTTVFNYKWSNSRKGTEYNLFKASGNSSRLTNHFESEHEISNKKFMFLNILEYCEKNKINTFDWVPFTMIAKINGSNYKENIKNFEEIFNNITDYVADDSSYRPKLISNYSDLFKSDIINCKIGSCDIYIPSTHYKGDNLWILKPTDLWGGKCIQIADNMNDIEKIIKRFYEGIEKTTGEDDMSESESDEEEKPIQNRYRASTVLLQKYIESPLLYYGRKFDIRMWALIDHEMNLYFFKEGHLKTTSKEYTTKTTDLFVHITNYSLQKHNDNFEKFEIGNEVSFKDFQSCLDSCYPGKNLEKDIMPQMINIIIHTALSVKDKLNKKKRKFCYLLLGYDFMIDTNFKVWLIEVNKNPGLVESSPIINSLVPRLLDDCFKLTLDPIFNARIQSDEKYPVEGYADDENMFKFLVNLRSDNRK